MIDKDKFRRRLEREKESLEKSIETLGRTGLDRSLGESISEFSTYDNHPADVGTETFEREKDFGLREDQMTTLDMVEAALRGLDEGTYGVCRRCGRPIPEARLDAVPWTAYCVTCESALEEEEARDWRRPAEEDVRPAFSSFNSADPSEPVEFDKEDAWQAVARYGTSSTPADSPPENEYDVSYYDGGEDIGTVEDVEKVPGSLNEPLQEGPVLEVEADDQLGGRSAPRGRRTKRRGP